MKKNEENKGFASASLVCGILGLLLVLMPYFGIVFSILGIVFSRKNKESGLSKGGLVTGIIGCALNGICLIFVVVILLAFPQLV